jgi:ATP-binding cassette, subfamily B, bacterial
LLGGMKRALLRFDPSRSSASALPAQPSMRERMWHITAGQRKRMAAMALIAMLSALAEAVSLALIAQIAAELVKPPGARVRFSLVHIHASTLTLIVIAFAIALARIPLLQVPATILPTRIGTDVGARIRLDLFNAFSHASWEVQSRDREGQMQETLTNQAGQASQSVGNLLGFINSTLTFTVLLASAIALNLFAALIVLALAVSMFALLRPLRGLGVRKARAWSLAQVNYATGVAESIRVAEEAHVFGAGAAQRRGNDARVSTVRRLLFQTQLLSQIGANISEAIVYMLLLGGLFVLHSQGDSHVGALGAVVLILVRASTSGQNIQSAYQGLVQSMPFLERTQEAERRYRESVPVAGTVALGRIETLAFEGVGYSYRVGVPVLSDVSFGVDGGEVIGVIGPSGAGKSTLVQLLLRLRAPGEGRYLVNGVPAQEILQDDWHRRVAYVPQEPRLLHASVAENIRFFRDIDDQTVEHAGRLARIHEDIVGWKDGYDTIVGPRADAVSGGQQQRICLARALVAQPELLVLDEPTSALDPTSESLIQESLTGLKQHDLTLFIVAHRMSTLNICDRVMIITDGRLAGFDTIDSLEAHNDYYRSASRLAAGGTLDELGLSEMQRASELQL